MLRQRVIGLSLAEWQSCTPRAMLLLLAAWSSLGMLVMLVMRRCITVVYLAPKRP